MKMFLALDLRVGEKISAELGSILKFSFNTNTSKFLIGLHSASKYISLYYKEYYTRNKISYPPLLPPLLKKSLSSYIQYLSTYLFNYLFIRLFRKRIFGLVYIERFPQYLPTSNIDEVAPKRGYTTVPRGLGCIVARGQNSLVEN